MIQYTPEQREAIAHFTGPMCVVAAAGSGKTATILGRIIHLVRERDVRPEQILAVTFTRAAAREMRERLAPALGQTQAAKVTMRTFHGLAYQILREAGSAVTVWDERTISRTLAAIMRGLDLNADQTALQNMNTDIARYRGSRVAIGRFSPVSCALPHFRSVLSRYEEAKQEAGACDYDDMIEGAIDHLRASAAGRQRLRDRWRFIMVDEYQDTNPMQFELLKELIGPEQNVQVVGDDDQAIYGWRGSEVRFILEFPREFPGCRVVRLTANFRTTSAMLAPAARLIANNRARFSKELRADRAGGSEPVLLRPASLRDEDDHLLAALLAARRDGSLGDTAVLYRTHSQTFALVMRLEKAGIPFRILSGDPDPFSGWAARDVLAYIRWAWDVAALEDIFRVLKHPVREGFTKGLLEQFTAAVRRPQDAWRWLGANVPAAAKPSLRALESGLNMLMKAPAERAIGIIRNQLDYDRYIAMYCDWAGADRSEASETLEAIANMPEGGEPSHVFIDLADAARSRRRRPGDDEAPPDSVAMATFHAAKGLEWPHVYIKGAVEGYAPHKRALEAGITAELEEERRLFYVAMTRARDRLTILAPREIDGKKVTASRFLVEAGLLRER